MDADVTLEELERSVMNELRAVPELHRETVGKHLVMFTRLIEDDPTLALAHAQAAAAISSRLALTREAVGEAAYASGEFDLALREFKTAARVSGSPAYLPLIADCERGLGRPERALALAGHADVARLDKEGQVEMRIVASGARRDLGELDAALLTLKCKELTTASTAQWAARLKYAYADCLEALGRQAEAREWFLQVIAIDEDELTDARERLEELDAGR